MEKKEKKEKKETIYLKPIPSLDRVSENRKNFIRLLLNTKFKSKPIFDELDNKNHASITGNLCLKIDQNFVCSNNDDEQKITKLFPNDKLEKINGIPQSMGFSSTDLSKLEKYISDILDTTFLDRILSLELKTIVIGKSNITVKKGEPNKYNEILKLILETRRLYTRLAGTGNDIYGEEDLINTPIQKGGIVVISYYSNKNGTILYPLSIITLTKRTNKLTTWEPLFDKYDLYYIDYIESLLPITIFTLTKNIEAPLEIKMVHKEGYYSIFLMDNKSLIVTLYTIPNSFKTTNIQGYTKVIAPLFTELEDEYILMGTDIKINKKTIPDDINIKNIQFNYNGDKTIPCILFIKNEGIDHSYYGIDKDLKFIKIPKNNDINIISLSITDSPIPDLNISIRDDIFFTIPWLITSKSGYNEHYLKFKESHIDITTPSDYYQGTIIPLIDTENNIEIDEDKDSDIVKKEKYIRKFLLKPDSHLSIIPGITQISLKYILKYIYSLVVSKKIKKPIAVMILPIPDASLYDYYYDTMGFIYPQKSSLQNIRKTELSLLKTLSTKMIKNVPFFNTLEHIVLYNHYKNKFIDSFSLLLPSIRTGIYIGSNLWIDSVLSIMENGFEKDKDNNIIIFHKDFIPMYTNNTLSYDILVMINPDINQILYNEIYKATSYPLDTYYTSKIFNCMIQAQQLINFDIKKFQIGKNIMGIFVVLKDIFTNLFNGSEFYQKDDHYLIVSKNLPGQIEVPKLDIIDLMVQLSSYLLTRYWDIILPFMFYFYNEITNALLYTSIICKKQWKKSTLPQPFDKDFYTRLLTNTNDTPFLKEPFNTKIGPHLIFRTYRYTVFPEDNITSVIVLITKFSNYILNKSLTEDYYNNNRDLIKEVIFYFDNKNGDYFLESVLDELYKIPPVNFDGMVISSYDTLLLFYGSNNSLAWNFISRLIFLKICIIPVDHILYSEYIYEVGILFNQYIKATKYKYSLQEYEKVKSLKPPKKLPPGILPYIVTTEQTAVPPQKIVVIDETEDEPAIIVTGEITQKTSSKKIIIPQQQQQQVVITKPVESFDTITEIKKIDDITDQLEASLLLKNFYSSLTNIVKNNKDAVYYITIWKNSKIEDFIMDQDWQNDYTKKSLSKFIIGKGIEETLLLKIIENISVVYSKTKKVGIIKIVDKLDLNNIIYTDDIQIFIIRNKYSYGILYELVIIYNQKIILYTSIKDRFKDGNMTIINLGSLHYSDNTYCIIKLIRKFLSGDFKESVSEIDKTPLWQTGIDFFMKFIQKPEIILEENPDNQNTVITTITNIPDSIGYYEEDIKTIINNYKRKSVPYIKICDLQLPDRTNLFKNIQIYFNEIIEWHNIQDDYGNISQKGKSGIIIIPFHKYELETKKNILELLIILVKPNINRFLFIFATPETEENIKSDLFEKFSINAILRCIFDEKKQYKYYYDYDINKNEIPNIEIHTLENTYSLLNTLLDSNVVLPINSKTITSIIVIRDIIANEGKEKISKKRKEIPISEEQVTKKPKIHDTDPDEIIELDYINVY